jgi:FAD synthase
VEVIERIREVRHYDSIEALVEAIRDDERRGREILGV